MSQLELLSRAFPLSTLFLWCYAQPSTVPVGPGIDTRYSLMRMMSHQHGEVFLRCNAGGFLSALGFT